MTSSLSRIRQSKTVRNVAVFASGNLAATILGMVGSLVQARYITPEDMGVFRTFAIFAGYLTFLHMGVFDGLQREIPLQMGRGNPAKAERAASACLAWITFISIGSAVVFLSLAAHAAYGRQWMQFWGWLAYLPVIVGTFYGGYLGTTYRSGSQFVTLSKASVIQAVAGTLVLPLFPMLGYFGACIRTAVTSGTNLFLLHRWRPLKVSPRLDWRGFHDVVRIGLPLSAIGYVGSSLWTSLEGSLVLGWFGIKALGLFTIAVVIRSLVAQLAQTLNQVLGVKVYEQYGRTNRVEDCLRLVMKPAVAACLASLPLIALSWFVMPWAVGLLAPKYVESVLMMQLMLLMMPITFLRLPATILWATARRIDCFISVATGFLVFAGGSYLLYRLNFGILSVVIASMLGQAVNVLISYLLILRLVLQERRSLADRGLPSYGSYVQA